MTDIPAILPRASPMRVVRSDAVRKWAFARLDKMSLPAVDATDVLVPEQEPEPTIFDGPWGWIMRAGLYLGGALLGYGLVRGMMLVYSRLTGVAALQTSLPVPDTIETALEASTPAMATHNTTDVIQRARALLSRTKAS